MELFEMTALELGRSIREKKLSAVEATTAFLDRIGKEDGK
jgi:Asp-tRNA(Asn)/Glu-tRNA(Gln) amidotransferase A subunit family amidase